MGFIYISATVAVLFPTYSNTCADPYVVRLLTLIFGSTDWYAYSDVLYVVLGSGIANNAVIFRAAVKFVVSGTMS